MTPGRLLMIYNADAGLVNGALDSLHKLFSPATYACGLCEVTYGLVGMKAEWAETLAALPHPVGFLHRDEWAAAYPGQSMPLPAILLEADGQLQTLVSAADFERVSTLPQLQDLLADRLRRS